MAAIHHRTRTLGVLVLLGGVLGLALLGAFRYSGRLDSDLELRVALDGMLSSEELILALAPRLGDMGRSVRNLSFPDHESRHLFRDEVWLGKLDEGSDVPAGRSLESMGVHLRDWPVEGEPETISMGPGLLWGPLLESVHSFDTAGFYFIRGAFDPNALDLYDSVVGFHGFARTAPGDRWSVDAEIRVTWKWEEPPRGAAHGEGEGDARDPETGRGWRVSGWETIRMTTAEASRTAFREVSRERIVAPGDLERALRSRHEEMAAGWIMDRDKGRPHPEYTLPAFDRHPALSVVDVDGNGLDDLYLMPQWGRNMLFVNSSDGTFREAAGSFGLDVEDHTAAAIFADFDNDGDPDAFLGRTLARSLFLRNEGGRFVDRSREMMEAPLPYLVTSASAADVNGDGLLDLYLSTYAARMLDEHLRRAEPSDATILEEYLPEDESVHLMELLRDGSTHKNLNRPGPSNRLWVNAGDGRFRDATSEAGLLLYRNSYQATFADVDGDGDADLYVANDFAPNNFYRNDGRGRFTDITSATGTADIGFGMGVSWGDYDRDGRQDLYVSNMYSKAGVRITESIPGLDPRIGKMARGNSLFRNAGERFEKVSGLEPPALLVEKALWSWGGQFVDVDNDGFLDIHAPSGYYTAPRQVAIAVDT